MQIRYCVGVVLALVLAAFIPAVFGDTQSVLAVFEQFKADHDKIYPNTIEETYRLGVFQENLKQAEEMNKLNPNAQFGVTQFMDLTDDEFAQLQGSSSDVPPGSEQPFLNDTAVGMSSFFAYPKNWEWYNSTNCSPVKNQGHCGSCWAHAAVEAVECAIGITSGKAPILSVQQVVNCAVSKYLHGCSGGNPGGALSYVRERGLVSEHTYPYTAHNGRCDYNTNAPRPGKIKQWYQVNPTEDSFQKILYKFGPLAVAIDASKWKTYKTGVLEKGCWTGHRNHAVLLTGWGVTENGVPFWNIRNSWSANWGEHGFIRIGRGNNVCGIKDKGVAVTLH